MKELIIAFFDFTAAGSLVIFMLSVLSYFGCRLVEHKFDTRLMEDMKDVTFVGMAFGLLGLMIRVLEIAFFM